MIFRPIRIGNTSIGGTHIGTLLSIVDGHTLGAAVGINNIDRIALANGIVWALLPAQVASGTILGNYERHLEPPSQGPFPNGPTFIKEQAQIYNISKLISRGYQEQFILP